MTNHPRPSTPRYLLPISCCLLFGAAFALYVATAAPGTLFGDPSEYQFVPAILGIAHPPGYAFYILLAKAWQVLIPLGTIAFRTNLLSAAAGAWTVTAVYLIVWDLSTANSRRDATDALRLAPPLVAALSLAVAPDLWQHAIHANAHIISAALAITHLWLLIRWWRTGSDRWLLAFAVTVGLAATHHPITMMGVPAYAAFILIVHPRILQEWRTLLALTGCALLGLTPLLYYPLRSPNAPFGPTDMNTLDGFLRHITARGLRGNLFHFGLADQPDRAMVFWTLLRLQYLLPMIALIVIGLAWLARRRREPAYLIYVFLMGHLLFTLNTVQDVMAYLLIPFAGLAIAIGLGVKEMIGLVDRATHTLDHQPRTMLFRLLIVCLLPWPIARGVQNLSRGISLHDFTAANDWVEDVYQRFEGQGEGAVLISDWEHLTPLWVHAYTEGETLREEDLTLVYASTAKPWPTWIWEHIEDGPIYVPDDRAPIRQEGFRLIPEGAFYRVQPPPTSDLDPSYPLDVWVDGRVQLLGYDLPTTTVHGGEPLPLILYQRIEEPLDEIWMPHARLGAEDGTEVNWTTDSRLLTPQWEPGEVVATRYEVPIPFHLRPGEYPLRLGYSDLTNDRSPLPLSDGETQIELDAITVRPNPEMPSRQTLEGLLANLDNQVGLTQARARAGLRTRQGIWSEPLPVEAGRAIHLTLVWQALVAPRDSATVFIHLIDSSGHTVTGHDYTPLGGSCPTYLWFPKWLPGQTLIDPYRLKIPPDVPEGRYWLEVGMYGMTSLRRLPVVNLDGDLAGDRVMLGAVEVK